MNKKYAGAIFKSKQRGINFIVIWNKLDGEYMFLNRDTYEVLARCELNEIEDKIKFIREIF